MLTPLTSLSLKYYLLTYLLTEQLMPAMLWRETTALIRYLSSVMLTNETQSANAGYKNIQALKAMWFPRADIDSKFTHSAMDRCLDLTSTHTHVVYTQTERQTRRCVLLASTISTCIMAFFSAASRQGECGRMCWFCDESLHAAIAYIYI